MGLRFRPAGLRFRPQGLRFRPVGLRFRPQGLRFRPVGLRFRPVGLRFRPVGLRFRPVGRRSLVFGLRFRHIPFLCTRTTLLNIGESYGNAFSIAHTVSASLSSTAISLLRTSLLSHSKEIQKIPFVPLCC